MDNVAGVRCFTEYLGRGQRIGLVPIGEKRLYVWTTYNSPREERIAPDLPRQFAQFTDPGLQRLFTALPPPASIITTEIEELWLETWFSKNAVLLGDAVHAMTPNIGGGGKAMEERRGARRGNGGRPKIEDALRTK